MHHYVTPLDARRIDGSFDIYWSSLERGCIDDSLHEGRCEVSFVQDKLKSKFLVDSVVSEMGTDFRSKTPQAYFSSHLQFSFVSVFALNFTAVWGFKRRGYR